MNQINIIHPYLWNGWWVFDDESKDLDKEPFVAGADTLLTNLLPPSEEECSIVFSKDEFPGADLKVEKVGEGMGGGTDYVHLTAQGNEHELWLCPALLKYFDYPPENIYFQLKPRSYE